MSTQSVAIAGRTIKVTNLDRVMYPDGGFTKAEVLQYFQDVAEPLGRQLRDRLLTRKRWPHGVATESFFEKNLPAGAPDWIKTVTAGSEPVRYPVLREDSPNAALAWFAQIGVLELHVPQWRVGPRGKPQPPDRIVFDLDPGAPAGLPECATVALAIRDVLRDLGLTAQPVLSGNKGMQLYVPLPESGPVAFGMSPDGASGFARSVAVTLEEAMTDLVVSRMTRSLRPGKVFVDWSQNNGSKTTIAPYSLRGTTRLPHVAAPVTWDEVDSGDLRQLGPNEVRQRLAEHGDPFANGGLAVARA